MFKIFILITLLFSLKPTQSVLAFDIDFNIDGEIINVDDEDLNQKEKESIKYAINQAENNELNENYNYKNYEEVCDKNKNSLSANEYEKCEEGIELVKREVDKLDFSSPESFAKSYRDGLLSIGALLGIAVSAKEWIL